MDSPRQGREAPASPPRELRLAPFFDLSLDLLCIANVRGRFVALNPAWERTLGWQTAELMAGPFLAHVHPDDRARTVEVMRSLARGETTSDFENRYQAKDGTWRWLRWAAAPEPGTGNVYAAARDVTAQKESQAALRRANEQLAREQELLEQLLDNSTAVVYAKDYRITDGGYLLVNRRFEELFGVDRHGVVGQTDLEIFPEQMALAFRANDRRVLAARRPVVLEEVAPHADGPHTYISVKFPLYASDGDTYAVAGISTDITERKLVEDALRESEARIRAILDTAADAIVTIDSDGTILSVNGAAEAMFAYGPHELLGKDVSILAPEPHRGHHHEYLARYLESGAARVIGTGREVEAERKDGTRFPAWLAVSEVEVGDRHLFCGIVRDLTEHKQLEAAEVARHATQAALEAKNVFLAAMSHELRTPLNAIMGMTQLALEQAPAGQQEPLELALSASHSLLGLVDDVLDYARMEAGLLSLNPIGFDIAALVSQVAQAFSAPAAAKALGLVTSVAADVPPVLIGDVGRVRQILSRLVENAVKFTDTGSVEVRVEVRADSSTPAADGSVRLGISVHDTGIGIAPAKQAEIFDVFTQAQDYLTRRQGGLGLGLAITARLAALMGGTITCDSALGRGSTFRCEVELRLPTHATAQEPPARPAVPASAHHGAPLRVLVIEDNAVNQKLACRLVEKWGHVAVVAENGKRGIEAWRAGDFDLVLMDLQMPEMDGLAATRAIRAEEATTGQHVPIVAVTAHTSEQDERECYEAGMDGFVPKPIDQDQLHALLAGLVGSTSG